MLTKTKIVLVATLFNLSFEFAFRGITGILLHPWFIVMLFLIYFSYYTIVEELIRKYRLTNFQLILVAFAFGLLPQTFLTGVIFNQPQIMGVNIIAMLGINIVWWAFTQGLLTMYLANRLVKRNWDEPLNPNKIKLAVGFIIFIHGLNLFTSPTLLRGSGIGYITVLVLFFVIFFYLKKTLSPQPTYQFERSYFLDILAVGSLVIFLFAGLVLAKQTSFDAGSNSVISKKSELVATRVTQITFFAILGYYALKRKRITI